MDRRALIAIALSTLLILTYQIFFAPRPDDVAPGETPAALVEGGAATERATPGDATARETGAPPPETGAEMRAERGPDESAALFDVDAEEPEGRIIPVRTPLYEMEIDTRGGLIRSIRLAEFDLPNDGGPVELIDPEGPAGLGLVIATRDGEVDVRGRNFNADRDAIEVGPEGEKTLTLERVLPDGIRVRRTFRFHGDTYRIDLEQIIDRDPAAPEVFSYRLLWEPGIAFTEGVPDEEKRDMAAFTAIGEKVVKDVAGKVDPEEGKERTGVRWAAVRNKYFTVAIIPSEGETADVRLRRIGAEDRVSLDMKFAIRETGPARADFGFWAGPLDMDRLKAQAPGFENMVDMGWSLIRPISRLTLAFVLFLHRYIPNYGLVIFVISLLTKLVFYRLTNKSLKSMKDMQRIQGQVSALREKYKNDAQRVQKETMALYKKEGVNPMGGCLPMMLQMPVFIALYSVLRSTIELRQAPFVWWINDLSRPDVLATLPVSLPFLGTTLSLLPLLMGVSMYVQQKMTTADPRQKAMVYMMPILFTFFFYRLPSGLVFYWLVNNVLSIGQQWFVHRSIEPAPAPAEGNGEDAGNGKAAQNKTKTKSKARGGRP
ncbi:MAG: membrane protein insertase YidC [Candidatus Eisenbacteria bacterium]|nr:membrane protein insertase YidC [Candidatus Eisenbacteria bacterium]